MTDDDGKIATALCCVRHVALDLDGTLYRGGRLFDVTRPFLAKLGELGIGYTFLTNNTSLSHVDYLAKLRRFKIDATADHVMTPSAATIAYLRDRMPEAKAIAVLGTPSLCEEFEANGFAVTWESPRAVVVGFDKTLDYDRLCRAAYWIDQGLPFLATHPDLVCPTDEPTVLVDCGAICAALTAATGRTPIVLGKPDPAMLWELVRRHGIEMNELAMVGDRIMTDIVMAQRAGALAVLVLSGEATKSDAAAMASPPELIVADVGELGDRLEESRSMVPSRSR